MYNYVMEKKLQKIIAKEGLIVLGIIVITKIGATLYFTISETQNHSSSFILSALFIYGTIRFTIWAIKVLELKPILVKYMKPAAREFLLIAGYLVLLTIIIFIGINIRDTNLKSFDFSSAMTINNEGKVEVTEENKANIEKLLGKNITEIPEQQIQLEVKNKLNSNKIWRNKSNNTFWRISRYLFFLILFSYPIYSLIRVIIWGIRKYGKMIKTPKLFIEFEKFISHHPVWRAIFIGVTIGIILLFLQKLLS